MVSPLNFQTLTVLDQRRSDLLLWASLQAPCQKFITTKILSYIQKSLLRAEPTLLSSINSGSARSSLVHRPPSCSSLFPFLNSLHFSLAYISHPEEAGGRTSGESRTGGGKGEVLDVRERAGPEGRSGTPGDHSCNSARQHWLQQSSTPEARSNRITL